MNKYIDMSEFDIIFDDIEEFVNRQGFTLGSVAYGLQKLSDSIGFYWICGVATKNQTKQMYNKFVKQVVRALHDMNKKD